MKLLGKRHRHERRFRAYSITALLLACTFLVLFFGDMIHKGYKSMRQTFLRVEISYNEESKASPLYAVDDDLSYLVSRGRLRTIPREIKQNPRLLNTTNTEWAVASADVDQYVKGAANRLRPREKKLIDRMKEEGNVQLRFNRGFFTNGDSKLPEIAGIKAAAVGTLYVIFVTILVSFPIGVLSAVYLEEFAPDNWLTRTIEVNINNLAAIPSILFGLLGLAIFINFMGMPRSSALVGGLTLSLMTLPVIIISTRVALKAVPDSIRQGALALGASKVQAVFQQVLPQCIPGVLTGTIIGMARAMGETAPLIIVGMIAYIPEPPTTLGSAATVLPAQIFTWSSASLRAFSERTAAAILVLLAILLVLNAAAIVMRNKFEKRW
ncbi:MAG: phosphate ABC transporter permease PstA [Verrucomicrobia bacterium]|nr:phosphate ABC transporter permease PstA [Verrucomicrobiota bacterium]